MDAYETLVIILSIFLGVFLLLGIVALSLVIAIIKKINRAVDHIEHAARNFQSISESAKKVASPLTTIASILARFKK